MHVWLADHIWPWKYSQLWPREKWLNCRLFRTDTKILHEIMKLSQHVSFHILLCFKIHLMQNLPNLYSSKINFNYLIWHRNLAYLYIVFVPLWENKYSVKLQFLPQYFWHRDKVWGKLSFTHSPNANSWTIKKEERMCLFSDCSFDQHGVESLLWSDSLYFWSSSTEEESQTRTQLKP